MSIEAELRTIALQLAQNAQQEGVRLNREIAELEREIAKKRAALNEAHFTSNRVASFSVKLRGIWGNYQCPRCWIEREKRSDLASIPGNSPQEDFFRCGTCDLEIPA